MSILKQTVELWLKNAPRIKSEIKANGISMLGIDDNNRFVYKANDAETINILYEKRQNENWTEQTTAKNIRHAFISIWTSRMIQDAYNSENSNEGEQK